MGFLYHNAIIVLTYSRERAEAAYAKAFELFDGLAPVTAIAETPVNSDFTFAILPDGSKEGWEPSERGDAARDAMKAWFKEQCFEDGSCPFNWIEIGFGEDDARVVDDSRAQTHADPRWLRATARPLPTGAP